MIFNHFEKVQEKDLPKRACLEREVILWLVANPAEALQCASQSAFFVKDDHLRRANAGCPDIASQIPYLDLRGFKNLTNV